MLKALRFLSSTSVRYCSVHFKSYSANNRVFLTDLLEKPLVDRVRHTPGYFTADIWSAQRRGVDEIESKLFGADVNKQAGAAGYMLAGTVHLSGKPVDTTLEYERITEFSNLPIDKKLLDNLTLSNINSMTVVQSHAIPILLIDSSSTDGCDETDIQRRCVGSYDLMAAAQTGSGKTLAFLVPLLNGLMRHYPHEAMEALKQNDYRTQFPLALILAPTRELAQQIRMVTSKLCYRTNVRSVALFGGDSVHRQISELERGCHVLIATPGRLLDLLRRGLVRLNCCRSLVLDEADRMLDMGFEPQLREILEAPQFGMPSPVDLGRQTSLFSATFPREVALLARDFLRGPQCISMNVVSGDVSDGIANLAVPAWGKVVRHSTREDTFQQLQSTIPREIEQTVEWVEGGSRQDLYEHLVGVVRSRIAGGVEGEADSASDEENNRILIFCNQKREVDALDQYLYRHGFRSAPLHGDKTQQHRNRAVRLFHEGKVNVLVATSIAARGLDFPQINAVVNFGLPIGLDDYVHRIGRTGRLGRSGLAITLVTSSELTAAPQLRSVAHGICRLIYAANGGIDSLSPNFCHAAGWRDGDHLKKNSGTGQSSYRKSDTHQRNRSSSFGRSSSSFDRRYR